MQEGMQRKTQLRTLYRMANINDEIIMEILYRLPLKYVHQFRCVSRGWLSLISHPQFFQNYFLHHKIPSFGVFVEPPYYFNDPYPEFVAINNRNTAGVPDPSLTSLLRQTGSTIWHACNGLFLCGIGKYGDFSFVCNPTTMEYAPLPLLKGLFVDGLNLVFDPSKSSTADYKVICIRRLEYSSLRQIAVYSSNTGSWRVSINAFYPSEDIIFHTGVLWNNAMNWTSLGESSLSYDIQAERLHKTPLTPKPALSSFRSILYFGASQGHLHFIEAYGSLTTEFDILEMEHDFSKWSIRYHVNLDTVKKAFPEMAVPNVKYNRNGHHLEYSVVYLLRGAEEGEVMLMINIPGKILSYRLMDGTVNKVCDLRMRTTEGSEIVKQTIILRVYEHSRIFPYMSILHSFGSSPSSC